MINEDRQKAHLRYRYEENDRLLSEATICGLPVVGWSPLPPRHGQPVCRYCLATIRAWERFRYHPQGDHQYAGGGFTWGTLCAGKT